MADVLRRSDQVGYGARSSKTSLPWVYRVFFIAAVASLLCKSASAQNENGTSVLYPQSISAQDNDQNATSTEDQNANAQSNDQNAILSEGQNGNGQSSDQSVMSAEQIIAILQQEPMVLNDVKTQIAQQAGVDPSAITDDQLYSRIRRDANLRAQISTGLSNLGFSTNSLV